MPMNKSLTAIVATLSLLGASSAASAAPAASKLSLSTSPRAGAKVGRTNQYIGSGWIIGALVAAAVIVAIVVIADDNDNPTSA